MSLTYMKCRDVKCTPERVIEKERALYMKILKRKCVLAKNPSKQDIKAYSACSANHYNRSRLKLMDDKQTKCLKKNCDHLIRFGGGRLTVRNKSKSKSISKRVKGV